MVTEGSFYTGEIILITFSGSTFNVVPCSFTIALDESSSNLCSLKGKRQCFSIFSDVNMSNKAKLTVNFLAYPSAKLRKIWQTGNKGFTSVGARSFCSIKRHKFVEIEKNCQIIFKQNYWTLWWDEGGWLHLCFALMWLRDAVSEFICIKTSFDCLTKRCGWTWWAHNLS